MAGLVYIAYINHHIRPAVYMGLASPTDPIGEPERSFMQVCDLRALEQGDLPVKIANLMKKKEGENG